LRIGFFSTNARDPAPCSLLPTPVQS